MSVRSSSHAAFLPGFLALHTAKALPLLLRYPVGELSVKCISQEAFIGRLARQTHNRRRIKQIAPPRYASSVVSPQERFSSPGEGGGAGGRKEAAGSLFFSFFFSFLFCRFSQLQNIQSVLGIVMPTVPRIVSFPIPPTSLCFPLPHWPAFYWG